MQSEPNNTSQNTLSTERTQVNEQPSHHGLDHPHERTSRPLHPGEGGRGIPSSTQPAEATLPPVANNCEKSERSTRRVNSTSSRTPSPVDRIIEHEKAVNYSPRRRTEGPGFTVIKGGRKLGNRQVALADFPNGMLSFLRRLGILVN